MEVSIQTDRPSMRRSQEQPPLLTPRAPTMPTIPPPPPIDTEEEQEKERYIKKLTAKNRQLLEDLKKQNEQLSKRISKQKARTTRTYQKQQSVTKTRGFQGVKRELGNAYKQIDMYKMVLLNLRAKGISSEAQEKLSNLENRIRVEDSQIQEYQRQLKVLTGIKVQQEKDIKIYENDQVKRHLKELESEAMAFREQLKTYKKTDQKRQEMYKKQHAYQLELERLLRQETEQYYPGKKTAKEEKVDTNDIDMSKVTETQWKILKTELKEARDVHAQYLRKIENLTRQKIKQVKSNQENELKLKEKQKIEASLQTKVRQLKKLILIRSKETNHNKSAELSQAQGSIDLSKLDSLLLQDPKGKQDEGVGGTPTKGKNGQREFKKWVIPDAKIVEKGKIFPNSIFFTDKPILEAYKKTRISGSQHIDSEVKVWTNTEEQVCLVRAEYVNENGELIEGELPQLDMTGLTEHVFDTTGGDYLVKIEGTTNEDNHILRLILTSRYGKKLEVGRRPLNGIDFSFAGNSGEIPTCLYGGYQPRPKGLGFSMCHLGCELIASW